MEVENHLELLGFKAQDKVTGFHGVVTSISFELYGCVQAVVTPEMDKDGETKAGMWFDVTRLKLKSKKPVMELPNFSSGYVAQGKKGCDVSKPLP